MGEDFFAGLKALFFRQFGTEVATIVPLPVSGSSRRYFRMRQGEISVLGVYNKDRKENEAFLNFTRHFLSKQLKVPQILAENLDENVYLVEDLGDETLFARLSHAASFDEKLKALYRQALKALLDFQTKGAEGMDTAWCYPRAAFDRQSITWDLNYFKYYFLKLAAVPFDEQLLENDFQTLTSFLLEAGTDFFLFRDFQSRNIMLHKDSLYFIDYQGGRKGALPYDVASLLYDAKADIPQETREELLSYYLELLAQNGAYPVDKFQKHYPAFVLVRILQAMGSYGYRGFYEQKQHFLSSVPFALRNISHLLEHADLHLSIPHLRQVLLSLPESDRLKSLSILPLTLNIQSFSYKRGLPADNSGHGGGFVFDCRCLPNPGREPRFRHQTGQSPEVVAYLEKEGSVAVFFEHVKSIAELAVENYRMRQFTHLSISFGCTGGQHRSVYFAEKLAAFFRQRYPSVRIHLKHCAENDWETDESTN
ncbi:MAG: phosphotransferase [Bacteroidales bacterium]|nr:phosphotransferase [Bacteroidales bacterium]